MAEIKPLSAELQKVAIEQLGEVPARIPDDLQDLRTWIQQQPHLRARTDDQFLIQFLRGCKYSLEKAKKKLDFFYTFKTKFSDYVGCKDVDSPQFRTMHNLGCTVVLPTPLNECGSRIVVFRSLYPADQYCPVEVFEPCNAMHELFIMNDPYACINGLTYITDMAKITFNHVLQLTPTYAKMLITYYEKSLPLRIKALYYINVPAEAEKLYRMCLPYLSERLRKRIFICGKNMDKLEDHIPRKYLPQEYGGENGCLEQLTEEYHKVWDTNRDYFKQNAEYGTDEHLRLGSEIDFEGLFGVCGSFRQLEVD